MDDIFSYSDETQKPQIDNQNQNKGLPPQNKPLQDKKKKSNKKKILAILAALFILLVGISAVYVNNLFGKIDNEQRGENNYISDDELFQNKNVFNVMVLGVDRRNSKASSRSDTMILVSLDKNNKKIKLTSFMRDMWVEIPGKKEAKINAACNWGGAKLALETVEYNFKIKIDKYVLIDFEMFKELIDILGGVEVAVTEKEAAAILKQGKLQVASGDSVHLNGEEALWFSRIRKLDSDFKRTSRQRMVINAVIAKAKTEGKKNPAKMLELAKKALPQVETDMTSTDLMKLFSNALSYQNYEVEEARIPADNLYKSGTRSGASVLVPDLEANRAYLQDFIYAKDSGNENTTD